ncbi:MAG: uracil-DNA glycosylase [bacterium]|nr:uracil-DNA glycosylase [bacterium]
MNKKEELEKLKREMEEDKDLPLRDVATQLVFGEGNSESKIYFIGEAPGFHEDRLGRPFVGQAGKLLDFLIETIGFKREDVYISNVVRFRPPENRDPLPEEILAFQPYVDREIEIINPKLIVTLGRFSMGKFLPGVLISKVHGKPKVVMFHGKNVTVLPMYHPAAALRSTDVMRQLREDFETIPKVLIKIETEQEAGKKKTEQMGLL